MELRGRGLNLNELDVREASGDWTRTSFTDVDLNRRYSAAEQAKFFKLPGQMTAPQGPHAAAAGRRGCPGDRDDRVLRAAPAREQRHHALHARRHRPPAGEPVPPARRLDADAHDDPRRRRVGSGGAARGGGGDRGGPGRLSGGGVGRARAHARARRGGVQAVRGSACPTSSPTTRRPRCRPCSPTPGWIAPRARSRSGWRSRWRRCSRGWRRPTRCSGSRRSCAASNARGPDRWRSTAIS